MNKTENDTPASKAGKPATKTSTGWNIPWGMIAAAVVIVALLYIGLPMWNKRATVAPAPVVVPVPTATETVKDGIRESLQKDYGTVHRTEKMKAKPVVVWESEQSDLNLSFPLDGNSPEDRRSIILGTEEKPPMFVDPKPGYRWVKVDTEEKSPARWKGAVRDTGRVWGIVPAALN